MLDRAVLKDNQLFLVSDQLGDVTAGNIDGLGLYFRDTRFLSVYELTVQGVRPRLLSAAGELNFMTNLQFANEAVELPNGQSVPARSISIRRNRFIRGGLHERIGFFSYLREPITLDVRLTFGSDFQDMFEVRGYARPARRGRFLPPEIEERSFRLRYLGLDGQERQTVVVLEFQPERVDVIEPEPQSAATVEVASGLSGHGDPRQVRVIPVPRVVVHLALHLPPGEPRSLTLHVHPRLPDDGLADVVGGDLETAFLSIRQSYEAWEQSATDIETDNQLVNAVLRRSLDDLRMLTDELPSGLVPAAGIPWFSVPFGRDSLITSLQTLMLQPAIAYGTLRFLAGHQGSRLDDWRDEEPGKILHEVRLGELAAVGHVPHTPYYGSVDSTPLFLIALGELLDWTDDWQFAREMEPHVLAALDWIDRYGDLDGDGFVEYRTRSKSGIRNQGWKDSPDAVCHRDGRPAELPIALVEVQGYVYNAKQRMSAYFERLGQPQRARRLRDEADALRRHFEECFWVESDQYYALALDGHKQPVRTTTSNVGHCLWSGIVGPERAGIVADRLVSDDLLSGWGVRTLSWSEPTYNPMSYHNGSVWPHDSALVAAGLKRQGRDAEAALIANQVFEAAMRMPLQRLPELFCGFGRDRRYYTMPAQYPVSCSPQAWAAASVYLLLQTVLGLEPRLDRNQLRLRPLLPALLQRVTVRRLRVGRALVDLEVVRRDDRYDVTARSSNGLDVVVAEPVSAPIRDRPRPG